MEIRAEDHLRLARYVANKWLKRGLPREFDFDELFAIASLGLVKAVAAFDPEKGKWVTYAGRVMDNQILMAVRTQRRRAKTVSLDSPLGEDGEATLGDTLPDALADDPEAEAVSADERAWVRQAVAQLPDRLRVVLETRFDEGVTQRDVSERLGVSRSYANRLESRAIGRLRLMLTAPETQARPRRQTKRRVSAMSSESAIAQGDRCLVSECGIPTLSRGLCPAHYNAHRRFVLGGPGTHGKHMSIEEWVQAGCPVREAGRSAVRAVHPKSKPERAAAKPAVLLDVAVATEDRPPIVTPFATWANEERTAIASPADPFAATRAAIASDIAMHESCIADLRADLEALDRARAVLERHKSA